MDKNEFLKCFQNEDSSILNLHDKILLAERSGKIICTNEFYTPEVWTKVLQLKSKLGINISTYGVFEEAERRILVFNDFENEVNYPIKVFKIVNKSKFKKLMHKDFLGGLMSLGLKREKLGDLVVKDDVCFGIIFEDMYHYVKNSLNSIGKNPCEIEEVDFSTVLPEPEFRNETVISTALRLDCIISALTGLSRSKSIDLISSKKVLLNYQDKNEKDTVVDMNSTITIRGYGKYRVMNIVGQSGSGRLKINIKKYI